MRLRLAFSFALVSTFAASSQSLIGTGFAKQVTLLPSDVAVLAGGEPRSDLGCVVKPAGSELGFDFVFHSGYRVSVPLRVLAGSGNLLTAVFRVRPVGRPEDSAYFIQKWKVPAIPEASGGAAELRGAFRLGEGTYDVEWLLRDRDERFCSAKWQVSAARRGRDRQVQLQVSPGTALPEADNLYTGEPPATREGTNALRVTVLVHVASPLAGSAALRPEESFALISMLRSVAREPRIGSYSVSAFNLDRNEVFFRQTNSPEIDFPALGEAIRKVNLGTVEFRKLIESAPEAEFLDRLVAEDVLSDPPDAVIFIGPKINVTSVILERSLKGMGTPDCPIFYLTYTPDSTANPWRDLIGAAVKYWKGSTYTISSPRELAAAWGDVMLQLTRPPREFGHPGRRAATNSFAPKK